MRAAAVAPLTRRNLTSGWRTIFCLFRRGLHLAPNVRLSGMERLLNERLWDCVANMARNGEQDKLNESIYEFGGYEMRRDAPA